MNVNPEDLIPKLPQPKDLQPFPTTQAIVSTAIYSTLFYQMAQRFKGVKPQLIDALLELCSPFLNGSNSAFIAAIASEWSFSKKQISVTRITTAWMGKIERR